MLYIICLNIKYRTNLIRANGPLTDHPEEV